MSTTGKPQTIDEVIAALDVVIAQARAESSKLGYFAALYRDVTMRVRQGIAEGRFQDGPRMERLDVVFANRYLDAHAAYRAGAPLSACWRIALDATRRRHVILQHLLLGLRADTLAEEGLRAAQFAHGAAEDDIEAERVEQRREAFARGAQLSREPSVGLL